MTANTHEVDFMLVIDLPGQISKDGIPALEAAMKTWMTSSNLVHVLNFLEVKKIDQATYRTFILYSKALREAKKFLYCINVNERIELQLRQDGLTSVLIPVENLNVIRKKHVERPAIDVRIINPFLESTLKVMESQANTKLTAGRPYVKSGEDPFPIEIAGLIALNSAASFSGSLVICFQLSTFLKIYSNMLGEEAKEITPEVLDGAGEIINIIYGQAKAMLNDNGLQLEMALPTVLVGDRLKIRHQARAQTIVLPFESDAGPLFIEIVIEKN